MNSLEKITLAKRIEIFEKLKNKDLLFRCTFAQISKHFLKEFLTINTFKVDFQVLKNAYLKNIKYANIKKEKKNNNKRIKKIEKAIKNENDFHKYICNTYLYLVKEPKEELLSAFVKVRQDIITIDATLNKIQKIRKKINNKKNTDCQKWKSILSYYKERNKTAKNEILDFVKNNINDYSLSNCCCNNSFKNLSIIIPYNYYGNPESYKPHKPNDLENKFDKLTTKEFQELIKEYNEDKQSFNQFLQDYIKNEKITNNILNLLDNHHILNERKEIISAVVNVYKNGDKIIFANAVPTIIEGILHDLCLLIGEDENKLHRQGFKYKLDKLLNVFDYKLYYEYYCFQFRLFRNKVAHGGLRKLEVNELTDLLLLDLHQICKLVFSTKLKLNQKTAVINKLNDPLSRTDYKDVLKYILLNEIDVPSFYKLESRIEKIEEAISNNKFWIFLRKEIELNGDYGKHGIHVILRMLMKHNSKLFGKKCKELLKKIQFEKFDQEIADCYINNLIRNY